MERTIPEMVNISSLRGGADSEDEGYSTPTDEYEEVYNVVQADLNCRSRRNRLSEDVSL